MISIKRVMSGLIVCSIFFLCNNDNSTNIDKSQYFSIKVIGKGIDCGNTYIIEFLEKKEIVAQTISSINSVSSSSGIFYGDGLKAEYQKDSLMLYIKFRKLTTDEMNVCTTLGPAYQHIMITDVLK